MSGFTRTAATVLAAAISFGASSSMTQAATKGPPSASVEGVWKIAKVVTTGANAATIASPQPSLIIFHRGYYGYVSSGDKPRAASATPKDPDKLTDGEKLSRYEEWEPLTGQAGAYEVKGTTLIRHPIVAKNVSVMTTDGPIMQELKLSGDSLVLISKSAAGRPARETRTTLTRVR